MKKLFALLFFVFVLMNFSTTAFAGDYIGPEPGEAIESEEEYYNLYDSLLHGEFMEGYKYSSFEKIIMRTYAIFFLMLPIVSIIAFLVHLFAKNVFLGSKLYFELAQSYNRGIIWHSWFLNYLCRVSILSIFVDILFIIFVYPPIGELTTTIAFYTIFLLLGYAVFIFLLLRFYSIWRKEDFKTNKVTQVNTAKALRNLACFYPFITIDYQEDFALMFLEIVFSCIFVVIMFVYFNKRMDFFYYNKEDDNIKDNFYKKMKEYTKMRDILFKSQNPESEDFGYSISNPIMTSSVTLSYKYLENLRTTNGKPFTWTRLGSYCTDSISGVKNVIVDKYKLYLDGNEYADIFICPYGHSSSYVPYGLTLKNEKSVLQVCPNCGKNYYEAVVFCDECGTDMRNPIPIVITPPPVQTNQTAYSDIKEKIASVLPKKKRNHSKIYDDLLDLQELLDMGLITQEEFDAKKKKILDI